MGQFIQQLINGLTLGAVYGLIALGYTMVYGIIGMINFAHGDIYMVAAIIAVTVLTLLGALGISAVPLAILITLAVVIFFTAIYGWSVERVAYRPLRKASRLAPLISAIGMSIFLQNMVQLTQGARVKPIHAMMPGGFELFTHDGFSVHLAYTQIMIISVTIILLAVFSYLITRTSFGRQQRACEQDQTMTALLGINVDRTISYTFMLGAALAAVAGVMVTVYYGVVDFSIGFVAGIKAFTAAVLGGIGSLPGAMLGGLIIGMIESFWSAYLSPEYKDVATFGILILVLMFRPSGLLGRPEVEKV
ncbi:High-affinity branched-chain amino acid transport system permease protein LivH [Andreprevotia sp. IGB-42]|uniref:ABC transporter permease subunit n=1 Tax=Andreprevotia sp. IGB-42 TaxID=2497473 RepID=UPI0013597E51|nr:branched-chain amino acid ABC transporter permease LivH [Andreprevotia sp. IGB-42]KAF0812864.1 High-affinity branched-chain amino acid transport system permease protein LivH [Andreprevotia sp. IGB-42]